MGAEFAFPGAHSWGWELLSPGQQDCHLVDWQGRAPGSAHGFTSQMPAVCSQELLVRRQRPQSWSCRVLSPSSGIGTAGTHPGEVSGGSLATAEPRPSVHKGAGRGFPKPHSSDEGTQRGPMAAGTVARSVNPAASASHRGTSACPGCAASGPAPCSWPRTAAGEGPCAWTLHLKETGRKLPVKG